MKSPNKAIKFGFLRSPDARKLAPLMAALALYKEHRWNTYKKVTESISF